LFCGPDASSLGYMTNARAPIGRLPVTVIALELFLALGALGGGAALMLGPRGQIIPLPAAALAGSPFPDYFVPGAILFAVIGLGPIVAAVLALRRDARAALFAIATGLTLLIWLAVEIAIIGYSNEPPLQPFYLLYGLVMIAVGAAWRRRLRPLR
jgi:hypothetical protein